MVLHQNTRQLSGICKNMSCDVCFCVNISVCVGASVSTAAFISVRVCVCVCVVCVRVCVRRCVRACGCVSAHAGIPSGTGYAHVTHAVQSYATVLHYQRELIQGSP